MMTTWSIDDHAFQPADPGSSWFVADSPDLEQPCGISGEEWCWHVDVDEEMAA